MIVGVMTVHSLGEGIGIGAASPMDDAWPPDHHRDRGPQHPRGARDQPRPRPSRHPVSARRHGASSRACRSHCSPFPPSCSSTPSRRSSPSGWDSRRARWCGWCSGSRSPRRLKRPRRGSSPLPAVPHLRSCLAFSSCCRKHQSALGHRHRLSGDCETRRFGLSGAVASRCVPWE